MMFFFFQGRGRNRIFGCDWISEVCSPDPPRGGGAGQIRAAELVREPLAPTVLERRALPETARALDSRGGPRYGGGAGRRPIGAVRRGQGAGRKTHTPPPGDR